MDRELASVYWGERERTRVAYFAFFNTSDLLRYSLCSGVALVVGRLDPSGAFRTIYDNRILTGLEAHSARYVLLSLDGQQAIIVRVPMRIKCLSYYETAYRALPNFPTRLPAREEDLRVLCRELHASLTFSTQSGSAEFRARSNGPRRGRGSLQEMVFVRLPSADHTAHVVLQIVQSRTDEPAELSAVLVLGEAAETRATSAGPLPTTFSDPSFPHVAGRKRRAKQTYRLPLCKVGRRAPPFRKLNFCCVDRECGFCRFEAPAMFKAKGIPTGDMTRETSPLFDPADVNATLELGNRIRACGLDSRYPQLLPKLARVRRLSLASFDIECFTHRLTPFPSHPPEGISTLPPGRGREPPPLPAAVQLPFLIGVSTLKADACDSDGRPDLDQIASDDFVLCQDRGFPTADSLEYMVLQFFSMLLDLAVRRSELKAEIMREELESAREFCERGDADFLTRSGGHKMEGTFVGRIFPQLREAVATIFVAGFNSGR